jgi:hypothetical protein
VCTCEMRTIDTVNVQTETDELERQTYNRDQKVLKQYVAIQYKSTRPKNLVVESQRWQARAAIETDNDSKKRGVMFCLVTSNDSAFIPQSHS